uniref:DNA/RNA-binding domain-containing protein n=1 Tax=Bicosoecida sp. CB-2014 TaxID=1486930 RepID=A0A7S1CBD5_9STRA|mmetsp:Transcript_18293/g.64787  ORF Transcript_18293/g.64787 Transcript_18293/m.64787 type:complete len:1176 (+) Transcript_18293:233-3760(+)
MADTKEGTVGNTLRARRADAARAGRAGVAKASAAAGSSKARLRGAHRQRKVARAEASEKAVGGTASSGSSESLVSPSDGGDTPRSARGGVDDARWSEAVAAAHAGGDAGGSAPQSASVKRSARDKRSRSRRDEADARPSASRAGEGDAAAVRSSKHRHKDIKRLEKRLLAALQKNTVGEREIASQRVAIRGKYERLIFDDISYAAENDLEQNMWKMCCYKLIERYRRNIREASSLSDDVRDATLRAVTNAFHEFCDEQTEWFQHLLRRFSRRLTAAKSKREEDASGGADHRVNLLEWSCHRCLIFIGDLARYKSLHADAPQRDWSTATHYYSQANVLLPASGNPHNQLAVLAAYGDAACLAVYRYCRSLMVPVPFLTARENLVVLYEKNRRMLLKASDSPMVERLEAAGPQALFRNPAWRAPTLEWLLLRVVRCSGMLFTGVDLETLPQIIRGIGRDTGRLLRAQSIGPDLLLQILVITFFGVHNTEFFPEGHVRTEADDRRRAIVKSYAMLPLLSFAANMCKHLTASVRSSEASSARGEGVGGAGASRSAPGVVDNPMTALLAPIGVMCDWMRVHPRFWTSEVPRRAPATPRGRRVGRGRHGDPLGSHFSDVATLESLLRHQLVEALVDLGNALSDAGAVPSFSGVPASSPSPATDVAGLSAESDDGARGDFVRRTLPEEVELRGFEPLRGMYDALPLPSATQRANDEILFEGRPVPSVFSDLDDSYAARTAVLHQRAAKVIALLECAASYPGARVLAGDTAGHFTFLRDVGADAGDDEDAAGSVDTAGSSRSGGSGAAATTGAGVLGAGHRAVFVRGPGSLGAAATTDLHVDSAAAVAPSGRAPLKTSPVETSNHVGGFDGVSQVAGGGPMAATAMSVAPAPVVDGAMWAAHAAGLSGGLSVTSPPFVPFASGAIAASAPLASHAYATSGMATHQYSGDGYGASVGFGARGAGGQASAADVAATGGSGASAAWAGLPVGGGGSRGGMPWAGSVGADVGGPAGGNTSTFRPSFGVPRGGEGVGRDRSDAAAAAGLSALGLDDTPASVVAAALDEPTRGEDEFALGGDVGGVGGVGGSFLLPAAEPGVWQRPRHEPASALPFSFGSAPSGNDDADVDVGGAYWGTGLATVPVGPPRYAPGSIPAGDAGTAGHVLGMGTRPWSRNPFVGDDGKRSV